MIRRDIEPQVGCLIALTALTACGTVVIGVVVMLACRALAAALVG